jgi:hypothetical protein
MKKKMRLPNIAFSTAFFLLSGLVSSCVFGNSETPIVQTSSNWTSDFPDGCLMQLEDLPAGWTRETIYSGLLDPELPNTVIGMANFRFLSTLDGLGWYIGQQVTVYASETSARDAFTAWVSKFSLESNSFLSELQPADNDLYTAACSEKVLDNVPIVECESVHQYNDVVLATTLQSDKVSITQTQFAQALMAVDNRCQNGK